LTNAHVGSVLLETAVSPSSGFAATLRDYARFGQFVLQSGVAGGTQVVPSAWFPDAGQPKRVGDEVVPSGYMWWSEPQGAFRAFGIFGQSIYVNGKKKTEEDGEDEEK
jgi:CubicO group peptidase (beta-lactamase class C family)